MKRFFLSMILVLSAFAMTAMGKSDDKTKASDIYHEWQGAWISDGHDKDYKPAPYFRKVFSTDKPIKKATAYISAGGLFRLSVNGERIGDHFLDPLFTRYDKRCLFVEFDITKEVREGKNALGVVLGNGWYNHQAIAVWDFDRAPWRNRPTFCMDVTIEYVDGTTTCIPTDLSWRTNDGAWRYNNIYTGEHYDFRAERKGWDTVDYDDSDWQGVRLRQSPAGQNITLQNCLPIRKIERIAPEKITILSDTCFVLDFGKNMAGIAELGLKGEPGTRIKVKYGERLYENGHLDMRNIDIYYRGDNEKEPYQTDIITLDGERDSFACEFSYKGFRYVEVTCSRPVNLFAESVVAWEVHSDLPQIGNIESGSEMLNKIFAATNQAYISNMMGYPTDCPQREKNGWTGDGHLAVETGLFSFDGKSVYEKWMQDHRDEQQPNGVLPDIIPTDGWGYGTANGLDWTSTIAIIPWNLYLFYGDDSALQACYENIKRYVDYVDRNAPEHLSSYGRGDWVPVKSQSNLEFTSSIYFYTDATILSKAAKMFGYKDDAEHYAKLAEEIRNALNKKYLHDDGTYSNGTQTELSMALYWGICPDSLKTKCAQALAENVRAHDYHLDVGVLGCKAILNALSENGYAYEAYRLAVQDTYPSWGWWIANGATSLHENWDIKSNQDGSDNHIMFGEIGAWLYKGLGGIYPDENEPGFKHIILRPAFIKQLGHFVAYHKVPSGGKILSSWTFKKNRVNYYCIVPQGCDATLYLPDGTTKELTEGEYKFTVKMK